MLQSTGTHVSHGEATLSMLSVFDVGYKPRVADAHSPSPGMEPSDDYKLADKLYPVLYSFW